MSVFETRHQLQRDTRFLYFIFTLLLILFFCVSQLIAAKIAAFYQDGKILYFSKTTLIVSASLITIFLLMYLSKLAEFGKGENIAKYHGALEVTGNVNNPYYKIYNQLVTETAIAFGTVSPRIYFIPFDSSINAFAAGKSPEDAIIVVNEGALEKLNQDELHALIAHEMSHIIHYDTRFNAHLSSIVYSMMGISILGKSLILSADDASFDEDMNINFKFINPLFYLGYLFLLFGGLFSWSGQLVQSHIARKRELLADSESVRALRNHTGIISLLHKIRSENQNMAKKAHHLKYSHFYFFTNRSLFPSHPPIAERIRSINITSARQTGVKRTTGTLKDQVGVNVRESDVALKKLINDRVIYQSEKFMDKRELIGFSTMYSLEQKGLYTPSQPVERKLTFDEKLARVTPDDSQHNLLTMDASTIFMLIPDEVKAVIYNPEQIGFLLYALILEENPIQQKLQLVQFTPADTQKIIKLHDTITSNSEEVYTYIIFEMIFPVLRALGYAEREKILNSLNRMLESKAELSIQQFCISYTLNNALSNMNQARRTIIKEITKAQLYELTHALFSIIAQKMSHYEDKDEQDIHLISAMRKLYLNTKRRALILDKNWQETLKQTLDDLQRVPLKDRENIIEALLFFVKLDQKITPSEYDMIRLISYRMGIPLSLDLKLVERT